jgi:hypothetical protein
MQPVSDTTRLFLILLLVAIAATSSLTTLIIVAVQSRKTSSWYWPKPDASQPHARLNHALSKPT